PTSWRTPACTAAVSPASGWMCPTGSCASRWRMGGRGCPRVAAAPFSPSSAARRATGSASGWRWCVASPRRTGAMRSPRTARRAARGWASPSGGRRAAARSGLLEHRADDPPHHPQLGPVPPAQVVAELGDLIVPLTVEVVEQRPERHVQAAGELGHRLQRRGEGPTLDAPDRVHRQLAALGQLLLGELAAVAEGPHVHAELLADVQPHVLSHPRAEIDASWTTAGRDDVPAGRRQIVQVPTLPCGSRRISPLTVSTPARHRGVHPAPDCQPVRSAPGGSVRSSTAGGAPPEASTRPAANRVPATWNARRAQTTTWPTARASSARPAVPSGSIARARTSRITTSVASAPSSA